VKRRDFLKAGLAGAALARGRLKLKVGTNENGQVGKIP